MMSDFLPNASLPSYLVRFPNRIKDFPEKLIPIELNGGFLENEDFSFLKSLASLLWDEQFNPLPPANCRQCCLGLLLLNWN